MTGGDEHLVEKTISKDFASALEEKYFLVSRNQAVSFIGGAVALAIGAGFLTVEVAKSAFTTSEQAAATVIINSNRDKSKELIAQINNDAAEIRKIKLSAEKDDRSKSHVIDDRIDKIVTLMIERNTLEERILEIENPDQRTGGPNRQYVNQWKDEVLKLSAKIDQIRKTDQ